MQSQRHHRHRGERDRATAHKQDSATATGPDTGGDCSTATKGKEAAAWRRPSPFGRRGCQAGHGRASSAAVGERAPDAQTSRQRYVQTGGECRVELAPRDELTENVLTAMGVRKMRVTEGSRILGDHGDNHLRELKGARREADRDN